MNPKERITTKHQPVGPLVDAASKSINAGANKGVEPTPSLPDRTISRGDTKSGVKKLG